MLRCWFAVIGPLVLRGGCFLVTPEKTDITDKWWCLSDVGFSGVCGEHMVIHRLIG